MSVEISTNFRWYFVRYFEKISKNFRWKLRTTNSVVGQIILTSVAVVSDFFFPFLAGSFFFEFLSHRLSLNSPNNQSADKLPILENYDVINYVFVTWWRHTWHMWCGSVKSSEKFSDDNNFLNLMWPYFSIFAPVKYPVNFSEISTNYLGNLSPGTEVTSTTFVPEKSYCSNFFACESSFNLVI